MMMQLLPMHVRYRFTRPEETSCDFMGGCGVFPEAVTTSARSILMLMRKFRLAVAWGRSKKHSLALLFDVDFLTANNS